MGGDRGWVGWVGRGVVRNGKAFPFFLSLLFWFAGLSWFAVDMIARALVHMRRVNAPDVGGITGCGWGKGSFMVSSCLSHWLPPLQLSEGAGSHYRMVSAGNNPLKA